jgi:hypothetical protein
MSIIVYFGESVAITNVSPVVPRTNGRFWKENVRPASFEMVRLVVIMN